MWQKEIRRALEPLELTHPQFVLLFSCKWLNEKQPDGVTQIQLAQHAKVDVNVTSQVLRSLEKRGLIARTPHPSDTRANAITVTKAGDELAVSAVKIVEAVDRSFFASLGDDRSQWNAMMLQLMDRTIEE
ncbi:MarR family transcriptional regulator [Paenibacillus sp. CCS19]|uniref:MarR family winged helix-turn-helix transcriptional regulator n=1 Tax=Paenibacillus sp. CCS19 TaxID=3158387 RepID=UPI00295F48AE|nr:MarR family transcriptional regulator [Paenibacillus cellulosilyticus]